MYRKYFVYLDDGKDVYKVAIAAACEDAARAWCQGNGEVIAVRDVTDDYPISAERVYEALHMGHIGDGRKHEDFAAPMHMVLNYEPCEECKKSMGKGFTVMEATTKPNSVSNMEMQKGVYPTGRFVVIKIDAARRIFGRDADGVDKAFMSSADFSHFFE